MTDPSFNLAQLERRPNWYEHISAVENAMAAQDQLYRTRWRDMNCHIGTLASLALRKPVDCLP